MEALFIIAWSPSKSLNKYEILKFVLYNFFSLSNNSKNMIISLIFPPTLKTSRIKELNFILNFKIIKMEIISKEENYIEINVGPQHPATHGVLRVILTFDGERIVKVKCKIGYLHRGTEKLGEEKNYYQMLIYTDRLDYLAPLSNNFAYVRAVEKLLGIENKIPKRIENPQVVLDYLSKGLELDSINKLFSNPKEITNFDWNMHRILCKHSNNIIFLFLLNSFKEIYFYFGVKYFSLEEVRERSINFYNNFYKYILKNQKEKAIQEMKNVTKDSIEILKKALTKNKEKL
jgi:hypothetical protein